MIKLWQRIRDWRKGIYRPTVEDKRSVMEELFEPPICCCGHYLYVHGENGCRDGGGWARDQWAALGPLRWNLLCRCKVRRIKFEDSSQVPDSNGVSGA